MINRKYKIRDGFQGEKLISIPLHILRKYGKQFPPHQLYLTHIGYFPKAQYHYRHRPKGCEDNILFYCISGKGFYKIDGIISKLEANQYAIVPASKSSLSYWADQNDPWSIYWVHFTGSEIEEYNHSLGINQYPAYTLYNEEGIKIWNKMYEILVSGFNFANLMNCNLCLSHLIATFIYPSKYQSELMKDINEELVNKTIEYMKENLSEKLNVNDIAKYNHLSASHLSKVFRKSTGMPLIDYFIRLKIQNACHLLHTTNLKIKEISIDLGYEDSYYFSRLFKKFMNISPESYRLFIRRNT